MTVDARKWCGRIIESGTGVTVDARKWCRRILKKALRLLRLRGQALGNPDDGQMNLV